MQLKCSSCCLAYANELIMYSLACYLREKGNLLLESLVFFSTAGAATVAVAAVFIGLAVVVSLVHLKKTFVAFPSI